MLSSPVYILILEYDWTDCHSLPPHPHSLWEGQLAEGKTGRAFGKWNYRGEDVPGWCHGIIKCINSPKFLGFYQNLMSDTISFLKSFLILQLEGVISPCEMLQPLPLLCLVFLSQYTLFCLLCSQYCLISLLGPSVLETAGCSLLIFLPRLTPNTVSDTIITPSIVVALWNAVKGCQPSPESHRIAFGQGY